MGDKGTEQLDASDLIEEWRISVRGDSFPAPERGCCESPRRKVMGAATALVERLGRPPLDEDHEDSGESALFA